MDAMTIPDVWLARTGTDRRGHGETCPTTSSARIDTGAVVSPPVHLHQLAVARLTVLPQRCLSDGLVVLPGVGVTSASPAQGSDVAVVRLRS